MTSTGLNPSYAVIKTKLLEGIAGGKPGPGKPKISISLDYNHKAENERNINAKLESLNLQDKIVYLAESRHEEHELLGQYSIELLPKDATYSTSSAVNLLMYKVLLDMDYEDINIQILACIYSDPYYRLLFMGDHYLKYTPQKYLQPAEENLKKFRPLGKNMSDKDKETIEAIKATFKMLDERPPQLSPHEKKFLYSMTMNSLVQTMADNNACLKTVLSPISEALAVVKVDQVQKKLGDKFDPTIDISLNFVKELLYSHPESHSEELLTELMVDRRTKFMVQKIEKVITRVMASSWYSEDTIFVPRVGSGHFAILADGLITKYGAQSIRLVDLRKSSLLTKEDVVKAIQKTF